MNSSLVDSGRPGAGTVNGSLLDGYGEPPLDEAVDPSGRVRPAYDRVIRALEALRPAELSARRESLDRARLADGIVFSVESDGELREQAFPIDPVPRLIGAQSWAHLAAGAVQRARALNAFLDDVHGPAAIVADGIIPERWVAGSPGYRASAKGLTPGGAPRATVVGLDLLTDTDGRWVVLEDNLRIPSGLGYALANRRTAAAAFPELYADPAVHSPEAIGRLLHRALADAAPPQCPRRDPSVVVLSDGPANSAWYEHHTLAEEMGVPVVTPGQLVADGDGVAARLEGVGPAMPVDVVYRRLGNDEFVDADTGDPRVAELLLRCARAGTVTIANAPGNGVADDKANYAFVGPMIRYYLGEEPLLADVGTWVLSEPNQYDAVRGRLGDLVVKPVDGSGGEGVMIGPELTDRQIRDLERAVAAEPHRFIAQDVIRFSTHPTVIAGGPPANGAELRLRPRHVDLRVFVFCGQETVVAPAALTRVALGSEGLVVNSSQGGGSKDTWLV